MAERGLTSVALAEMLGVSRQMVHKITSGRSRISPEVARKLQRYVDGSMESWLSEQAAYDISRLTARPRPKQK
jgi:antitoxin HigA-1